MEKTLKTYLGLLLRPVIAFAIRHGMSIQDFFDTSKALFVEIAAEEITRQGKKITPSKISAMSGIRRPEVKKIIDGEDDPVQSVSLVSRVLAQWEQDPEFLTKTGKPKVLEYGEVGSEFNRLVAKVSTDLHPASILFELERLQLVKKSPRGLSLLERRHVPVEDIRTGFGILSDDMRVLISTVEENILSELSVKHLHAKTVYDNIYHEDLDTIRQWLLTEGAKFHHKIRNYLARFDKDINVQKDKTPGAKVTLCTFANTEEARK